MSNSLLCLVCFISWLIGAMMTALIIGDKREEQTASHHIFTTNEDFVDVWRDMEQRTGVTLLPNIAHQLYIIEQQSSIRFYTIPVKEANHQKQQNHFKFTKWMIDNGKLTDHPVDELA